MTETLRERVARAVRALVVAPGVEEKIDAMPNRLCESGYDAWGFSPEHAKWTLSIARHLYERWFRVETTGIANVPRGRVLLAANHSGQLPLDGMMIASAMALDAAPPRLVRAQIEKWFPTLPVVSAFLARNGQVVGTPKNCVKLLENDEAVLVFPEGIRGSGKPYRERYRLQKFGGGFMRLALKTRTPIVPVAVVGGEETYPSLFNIRPLARLFGFPYFPVTPAWPLLGPLGLVPLPSKFRLFFDEPILFAGDPDEPDEKIDEKVGAVRSAIEKMLQFALENRRSVFR